MISPAEDQEGSSCPWIKIAILTLIILIQALLLASLFLEFDVLNSDKEWNFVLERTHSFPNITWRSEPNFLQTGWTQLNKTALADERNMLIREHADDYKFIIVAMVAIAAIVVYQAILCHQRKLVVENTGYLFLVLGIVTLYGVSAEATSSGRIEDNYLTVIAKLDVEEDNSTVQNYKTTPLEELDESELLRDIFQICVMTSFYTKLSPGNLEIRNTLKKPELNMHHGQVYGEVDFRKMRFCQKQAEKGWIMLLGTIAGILAFIIVILYVLSKNTALVEEIARKSSLSENSETEINVDPDTAFAMCSNYHPTNETNQEEQAGDGKEGSPSSPLTLEEDELAIIDSTFL